MKKDAQTLVRLASTALKRAGANDRMAEAAARHLVHAEEHGLPTHGMSRVPFYCGMLRKGRADGQAQPSMVTERAGVCLIDNCDGLPYVSAQWAIEELIQRARRNGIAFAGIRNSAHVGVMGIHLLPVAQAGMVGFAFTNSPAAIPAWGGKKALFGTNPVAAVFPRRTRVRRLFVDEITAVRDWQHALKRAIDAGHPRGILVVTTGSKAADLRRESERLRGLVGVSNG